MKRPWHYWSLFALALLIAIPSMVWLSIKTIEVDQRLEQDRKQTELARREAELQERLSSALYRLDLKLLPLVAQEAARPYYLYDTFYESPLSGIATNQANLAPPPIKPSSRGKGQVPTFKPRSSNGSQQNDLADLASGKGTPQQSYASAISELDGKFPSPLMFDRPEFVRMHFQIDASGKISSPQVPTGTDRTLAIRCCGFTPPNQDETPVMLAEAKSNFQFDELVVLCATPTPAVPASPQTTDVTLDNSQLANAYNVPQLDKISQSIDMPMQTEELLADNKFDQQRSRNNLRVNQEFSQRQQSTREFADRQWVANHQIGKQIALGNMIYQGMKSLSTAPDVQAGTMQPMWVGENLILARRVETGQSSRVQICWLDWPAIRTALQNEVEDLFPKVEFQPIDQQTELVVGTAMTTLPVQLVVDSPTALSTLALEPKMVRPFGFSGLTLSLLVAWIALGCATLGCGLLLHGVLMMSERRASFVSAVTHELRTPLTTFRMYAEMLAENMVPEEKTQEYAHTLRVQADRLSHLVENVLQFARLERGSQSNPPETIAIGELIDRFEDRLAERAEQEAMHLTLEIPEATAQLQIQTQPAQIEQVLFNLVDNATKYAKPSTNGQIILSVDADEASVMFRVQDYGPGIDAKHRKRLFQPFCKSDQDAANTAPGVGLGLALCLRMASSLGGRLFLQDTTPPGSKGKSVAGACFVLELPRR